MQQKTSKPFHAPNDGGQAKMPTPNEQMLAAQLGAFLF